MSLYVDIPTAATATATTPGLISAADQARLDRYNNSLEAVSTNFLMDLSAQFNLGWSQAKYVDAAIIPLGSAAPTAQDSGLEGQGVRISAGGTPLFLGESITSAPKTRAWGIEFYGVLGGNGAGGKDTFFELLNGASTHSFAVGRQNSTSTTKYTMQHVGTAVTSIVGTVAADTNKHRFTFFFDGATTIRMYVDATSATATPDATFTGWIGNATDEALYPAWFANAPGAGNDCVIFYYAFAVVG